MTFFQLREWWRYRRSAKGRHGVHSPFVYRFIDEALRPRRGPATGPYRSEDNRFWQGSDLMQRIAWYIAPQVIDEGGYCYAGPTGAKRALGKLLIRQGSGQNPEALQACVSEAAATDIVAITGIHRSTADLSAWRALQAHPRVTLSIDLFSAGLLFFSPDFKEKQHFVLKYPY